jgi:hypothetical protein
MVKPMMISKKCFLVFLRVALLVAVRYLIPTTEILTKLKMATIMVRISRTELKIDDIR